MYKKKSKLILYMVISFFVNNSVIEAMNLNNEVKEITTQLQEIKEIAIQLQELPSIETIIPEIPEIIVPINIKGVKNCLNKEGTFCFILSRVIQGSIIASNVVGAGLSFWISTLKNEDTKTIKTASLINGGLSVCGIILAGLFPTIASNIKAIDKKLGVLENGK